jgi:ribosome maturation factor RimP
LPHPASPEIELLARRVGSDARLRVEAVEILTHRIPMTVRVVVDRSDGADVTLEQCAALSGPLGEALEASGLLEQSYVLEVSSPGIGEELRSDRDFGSFRSFPVEVIQREPSGAEVSRQGLLLGRDDEAVLLNLRGRSVRIPRDQVVRVRLVQSSDDP